MAASRSSLRAARWIVPVAVLALAGLAFGATAVPDQLPAPSEQVSVAFVHPEKFTDLRDRRFPDQRITAIYMGELRHFIETRAAEVLGPDRKLEVTITDIDMAGDIEPTGVGGNDYRVLRDSMPPRIDLTFRIVDATGRELKSGDRHLTDLDYQRAEFRSHDTPLYFEKRLLSNWLSDETRR